MSLAIPLAFSSLEWQEATAQETNPSAATTVVTIQEGAEAPADDAAQEDSAQEEAFAKFEALMSGSKLVGHFTILGQESGELTQEEYHIQSVRKLEEEGMWMFRARVKYAEHDVTVPLPLEVEWAGDTPVITLTDFEVPLLGTFSARVLIYNDKYAGTWSHGDVGGHLFGEIKPGEAEEQDADANAESSPEK